MTLLLGLSEGPLLRLLGLDLLEMRKVLRLVDVRLVAMLEDYHRRVCAEGDQERGLDVGSIVYSSNSFVDRHGMSLLELHGERRLGVSSFKSCSCLSRDRHHELPNLNQARLLSDGSVGWSSYKKGTINQDSSNLERHAACYACWRRGEDEFDDDIAAEMGGEPCPIGRANLFGHHKIYLINPE